MFRYPGRHRGQSRIQSLRIIAPGLGEIRPSATLAAHLLGYRADDVPGLDPLDIVSRDTRSQADLAVIDRAENDDRALQRGP